MAFAFLSLPDLAARSPGGAGAAPVRGKGPLDPRFADLPLDLAALGNGVRITASAHLLQEPAEQSAKRALAVTCRRYALRHSPECRGRPAVNQFPRQIVGELSNDIA